MKTLKKSITIITFLALPLFGNLISQEIDSFKNTSQFKDSVSAMEMFRKQLSGMGEWINIDSSQVDAQAVQADPSNPDITNEGVDDYINKSVIWRPNNIEDPEWNPYSYGFWQYTSCGWMWMSYYQWGWATCHYGRWWYSPEYGWVWSPGYIWAPAWVSWCYDDQYNYIGWYPLSPREHCDGEHPNHQHHVRHENPRWVFVTTKDFEKTINHNTTINPVKNPTMVNEKKIVTSIKVYPGGKITNEGPDKEMVEKISGRKTEVLDVDKLGNQNWEIQGTTGEKRTGTGIEQGNNDEGKKKTDIGKPNEKVKENNNTNNNNTNNNNTGDIEKKKQDTWKNGNKGNNNTNNNNTNTNNNNTNIERKPVEKSKPNNPPPPPPPPPTKNDDTQKPKDIPKDTPKKDDTKKGDN